MTTDMDRFHTLRERLSTIGALGTAQRIAREHGVSVLQILAGGRAKHEARARAHLAATLRWTLGLSYPEIGRALGIDHTTAMDAERTYGAFMEESIGVAQADRSWTSRRADRAKTGWMARAIHDDLSQTIVYDAAARKAP